MNSLHSILIIKKRDKETNKRIRKYNMNMIPCAPVKEKKNKLTMQAFDFTPSLKFFWNRPNLASTKASQSDTIAGGGASPSKIKRYKERER